MPTLLADKFIQDLLMEIITVGGTCLPITQVPVTTFPLLSTCKWLNTGRGDAWECADCAVQGQAGQCGQSMMGEGRAAHCEAAEGRGDHVVRGLVASARNLGLSRSAVEMY